MMKRTIAALALVALAACAQTSAEERRAKYFADIDVTAGPGEPRALDSICTVRRTTIDAYTVAQVLCPMEPLVEQEVRYESLTQGFGYDLMSAHTLSSGFTIDQMWFTNFVVDDGATDFRPSPNYPRAAMQNNDSASCMAQFDLTPEGAPTDVCVVCAATGSHEAFEQAVRKTLSRWSLRPASVDAAHASGEPRIVAFPFIMTGVDDAAPLDAPDLTDAACSVEGD